MASDRAGITFPEYLRFVASVMDSALNDGNHAEAARLLYALSGVVAHEIQARAPIGTTGTT
jgi:hypothetical protein